MSKVLIIEDDAKIRAELVLLMRDAGFLTTAAEKAEDVVAELEDQQTAKPDLLLLDVRLPGMSGVELVRRLVDQQQLPTTIIVSGEASISETVDGLQFGVYDFIEKPFSKERLLQSVHNAIRHTQLKGQLAALRAELDERSQLLGSSPEMSNLREMISKAAASQSRVLIQGESGTGKELVADSLHRSSSRCNGPFIKINCAALPSHLIEDELFGHVKGAFTDAHTDRPGLFEEADGGTLLLDEIGDMDLHLQTRLLRVLEEGSIRRIGDGKERSVNVRVLAATHNDLEQGIKQNRFRQDLFFRLAHLVLEVPPLRQRRGDISLLFQHFLDTSCRLNRSRPRRVDSSVLEVLEGYRWPGNVRELKNLSERLVVFGSDPVTVEQLPSAFFQGPVERETGLLRVADGRPAVPLREFKRLAEKEYIEIILQRTNWNVTAAAALLNLQRTYLHQKIVALGIHKVENR